MTTPTIRQVLSHRAAADPAQPHAGLRPPRPDRVRGVRHRQDHRAHPARPHPRAARSASATPAGRANRLPVVYVTVPPAATARMLAVEFARFLGLQFASRANITDIVDAVCATAAHTGVELVLVDEIHNLNLATRTGAEVSDPLKYFAERLPATFVYAGHRRRSARACSPAPAAGRSPAGSR